MIEIENVRKSFGSLEVLKGIDLTVDKGEVVTIIGGSGSGKSTAIALLQRFYDVGHGQVMIDGVDIKTLDPSWLRANIGLVLQGRWVRPSRVL